MSTHAALTSGQAYEMLRPARRLSAVFTLQRLPAILIAAAMAACTVSLWFYVRVLHEFVTPDSFDYGQVLKPRLFYVSYGLEIISASAACLLAVTVARRRLRAGYEVAFLLFVLAGLLMTVRGYTMSTLASTKLVASTGPLTVVVSALIFTGAQRENWRFLDKMFLCASGVYSVLVTWGIVNLQSANRWEATLALGTFLNSLYFPAAWLLLRPTSQRGFPVLLRYVPFGIYAVGSIFTQTRLNWVMIFGALVLLGFLNHRRRLPVVPLALLAAGVGLWLALFSAAYLTDVKYLETFQESAQAFVDRLDEDTRSNQMQEFFSNVPLTDLLLGRGSLATWNWAGVEWPGGTDVGYLSLLFYGGLPLLVTYVALHVAPVFRAIRRPQSEWQRTCAAIGLLWALRMFSSTFPGTGIDYYVVVLCIGACVGLAEPRVMSPQPAVRSAN